MTKIQLKPKNDQNTLRNIKHDQNTPETLKMTKIPLKPKNVQNTPQNPKNDQNTPET